MCKEQYNIAVVSNWLRRQYNYNDGVTLYDNVCYTSQYSLC